MRKLLICSPSHALRGGVETIVNDLCRELPQRGWDVTLALGKGARFNNVEAYRNAYPDLPIVAIDGTTGTRHGRLKSLTKLIKSTVPDVVLSARIIDAYEVAATLKNRRIGPRLAVAVRAYEPHYLYDARLYRDCIDLCVADGKLLTAALIEWSGFAPDRVANVPGGIQPPHLRIPPRQLKRQLRLGYVGRLEQSQKRILDLIPLVYLLNQGHIDYSLDIIGTGPEESNLKEGLREGINCNRVRFHGWQDHESLYQRFFPEMDCLIHLAHTEGVTIAPREAMVHGVVPVISQFTGLKSENLFVHGWNCLTFPAGEVTKAAANITRLIHDPELLHRLSINTKQSQTGPYSLIGSMDAWATALNRCLEQAPASGPAPKLNLPADGRLTRMGIPPKVAQYVRDLFGKKYEHSDPGSEWPTNTGLMTNVEADEIMQFALDYEARIDASRH